MLLAPQDGVIGQAPSIDEVGKYFDLPKDQSQSQPLLRNSTLSGG